MPEPKPPRRSAEQSLNTAIPPAVSQRRNALGKSTNSLVAIATNGAGRRPRRSDGSESSVYVGAWPDQPAASWVSWAERRSARGRRGAALTLSPRRSPPTSSPGRPWPAASRPAINSASWPARTAGLRDQVASSPHPLQPAENPVDWWERARWHSPPSPAVSVRHVSLRYALLALDDSDVGGPHQYRSHHAATRISGDRSNDSHTHSTQAAARQPDARRPANG